MARIPLESKLLQGYSYDPAQKVLEVQFRSSLKVYRYSDVTPEEFEAFLAAKSQGSHFLNEIKSAKPCKRVEDPDEEETETEG